MSSEKKGLLIIEEPFLNQFERLCRLIPGKEWSGMLAYKISGSLMNPETLKVTPKFIHLMDIGTAVSTEYDFGAETVKIFDDYPEVVEMRIGNIHSHNYMDVFFSGTDVQELEENSKHHHVYLSVIVNNHSKVIGRLAVYLESEVEVVKKLNFSIKDLDDKVFNKSNEVVSKEKQTFLYQIELEVQYPEQHFVDPLLVKLDKRYSDILKSKEEKEKARYVFPKPNFNSYIPEQQYVPKHNVPKHIPDFEWDVPIKKNTHKSSDLTIKDKELIYEGLLGIISNHTGIENNSLAVHLGKLSKSFHSGITDSISVSILELVADYDELQDAALAHVLKLLRNHQQLTVTRLILQNLGAL